MKTLKMLSPNLVTLVSILLLYGLASPVFAKSDNDFVFARDCTFKNLDAATNQENNDLDSAKLGKTCIEYISLYLDAFQEGSVVTENYLTSEIETKIEKIEGVDLDKSKEVTPLEDTVLSSTKNTPYKLCIPKDATDVDLARTVVAYLDAKPYARQASRAQDQILDALWEKYQNSDFSCKMPENKEPPTKKP